MLYDSDMIGCIEGRVRAVFPGFLLIMVGGIGYKVAASRDAISRIRAGEDASFWTHLVVREDALDLYGFLTEQELRLFELLLTVSGIGPKSAIAILDIATAETLKTAISQGNSGYLTNISGIGKKTAEKIIVELRDKMGAMIEGGATALKGDEEALEAMRALGYSVSEARDALKKVPREIESGSERLRAALKVLGS